MSINDLDEIITDIIDEFNDRQKKGENPSIEEFTNKYPGYENEIRTALESEIKWKSRFERLQNSLSVNFNSLELNNKWENFKERITPMWLKAQEGVFKLFSTIKISIQNQAAAFVELPENIKHTLSNFELKPAIVAYRGGPTAKYTGQSISLDDNESNIKIVLNINASEESNNKVDIEFVLKNEDNEIIRNAEVKLLDKNKNILEITQASTQAKFSNIINDLYIIQVDLKNKIYEIPVEFE